LVAVGASEEAVAAAEALETAAEALDFVSRLSTPFESERFVLVVETAVVAVAAVVFALERLEVVAGSAVVALELVVVFVEFVAAAAIVVCALRSDGAVGVLPVARSLKYTFL